VSSVRITRRSMIASTLALCSQPQSQSPKTSRGITLRVNATPSIFKPTFEHLAREFERRRPPLRIDLSTAARDAENQIQSTLRLGLIDSLPDVSFEGLRYLRTLKRRHIAVPLTSMIAHDAQWRSDEFSESVIKSTRVDGEIMGIGAAVSLPIIYYDADQVERVLGRAPFPDDWPTISTLLFALGKGAKPGRLGGFIQHTDSSWVYMSIAGSFGGHPMNADESKVTLDDAAGIAALQVYETFGRAGQAHMDMGREQARQAFTGGAIALLVDSSSSLTRLQKQIAGRFRLATARLPLADDGYLAANGTAAVICARECTRQAIAWDFVKFVCGPEGQNIIGKSTGYLPANDVALQRADLLAEYYRSQPLLRPVAESLPHAALWYAFPGGNSLKIDAVIVDGVNSVVTLAQTPHRAAATMKRTIERLLPPRASPDRNTRRDT
jgi:multiple sugar transport system substrate-binding protein